MTAPPFHCGQLVDVAWPGPAGQPGRLTGCEIVSYRIIGGRQQLRVKLPGGELTSVAAADCRPSGNVPSAVVA